MTTVMIATAAAADGVFLAAMVCDGVHSWLHDGEDNRAGLRDGEDNRAHCDYSNSGNSDDSNDSHTVMIATAATDSKEHWCDGAFLAAMVHSCLRDGEDNTAHDSNSDDSDSDSDDSHTTAHTAATTATIATVATRQQGLSPRELCQECAERPRERGQESYATLTEKSCKLRQER